MHLPNIPQNNPLSPTKRLALGFVSLWFLLGGVAHFVWPGAFAEVVPPALPYPLGIVYVTGVCELAGAAGLLWWRTRALAGAALALFTLCVTPANIYMWQQAASFPAVPPILLLLRLPLQAVLIALILWASGALRGWPRKSPRA